MRKFLLLTALIFIITGVTYSQDNYKWEINAGASYYPKGLFPTLLYLNKTPGRHSTLTLQLIGGQVGLSHYFKNTLGIGGNINFSKFNFDFDGINKGVFRVNHIQKSHTVYIRKRSNPIKKVIFYGQFSINMTSFKRSYEPTEFQISSLSVDSFDSYFNRNDLNFSTGLLAGIEKRMGSRMALYLQFGHDDIFSLLKQDDFYFSIEGSVSNGQLGAGQGLFFDGADELVNVVGVQSKYLPYHIDFGLVYKFSKDKF